MANLDRVPSLLAQGYECLKNADLGNASKFFEEALSENFSSEEVLFAMKCARFWKDCLQETESIESPQGKADRLVTRWISFNVFLSRISGDFEMAKYAFKRMAFSAALDFYLSLPETEKTAMGPEFEAKVGRCRKSLGDYETAQAHFERAVKARKDDARYLAELADCHSLSGEQRLSKLLFREAFHIAPEKVEISLIESDMIGMLVEKVKAAGVQPHALAAWIPVYGELGKVFDVKRELTAQESSRLNSSILQLENDLRENPALKVELTPKLLDRYFWMVDYYKSTGADSAKIDRVLSKIRLLDQEIFKQYVS